MVVKIFSIFYGVIKGDHPIKHRKGCSCAAKGGQDVFAGRSWVVKIIYGVIKGFQNVFDRRSWIVKMFHRVLVKIFRGGDGRSSFPYIHSNRNTTHPFFFPKRQIPSHYANNVHFIVQTTSSQRYGRCIDVETTLCAYRVRKCREVQKLTRLFLDDETREAYFITFLKIKLLINKLLF